MEDRQFCALGRSVCIAMGSGTPLESGFGQMFPYPNQFHMRDNTRSVLQLDRRLLRVIQDIRVLVQSAVAKRTEEPPQGPTF